MKYFFKIIKYSSIAIKLFLVILEPQILLASSKSNNDPKDHFAKKTEVSEICEIRPVDDELVRGRASFVTFPDKRNLHKGKFQSEKVNNLSDTFLLK